MPTLDEILQQGKSHHRAGDLHGAERCYRQAVEMDADSLEAHYLLGAVSHALDRPDAAVAGLSRAVQLRPEFAEAHHHLGVVLTQLGQIGRSHCLLSACIELKPDEAGAHLNLGAVLAQRGELDEAIACYRRAIEPSIPNFPRPITTWAWRWQIKTNWMRPVASYQRALELRPDYAEAQNNLGGLLERQDKLEEAAACCQRALQLMPGYAEAYNTLANILERQGNHEDSQTCYRRCDRIEARLRRCPQQSRGGLGPAWPTRRSDRLLPPRPAAQSSHGTGTP